MFSHELIVRTKLIPPRVQRHILQRRRLAERLAEVQEYRLTIVHADAGYGKSTALVTCLRGPVAWYSITETDTDPFLFLLYVIYAFQGIEASLAEKPLAILEERGAAHGGQAALDALTNGLLAYGQDITLVLDDYHLVATSSMINELVNHFVDFLPSTVHVVIATRQMPTLAGLPRWRARREVLDITRQDLAFSSDEIDELFRTHYGLTLTPQQIQALATETEGWIIAIQMIWQGLPANSSTGITETTYGRSLSDLFAYLAQEVLARQPPAVQDFLLRTSVLRYLEPAACDALLDNRTSGPLLQQVEEAGLFLIAHGPHYRYHHLFHEFLRHEAERRPDIVQAMHKRAAHFYRENGHHQEAVYHLLASGDSEGAADLITHLGDWMVQSGHLTTLAEWIEKLPVDVLAQHPILFCYLGDVCRLTSQFDAALAWYQQAQVHYAARNDRLGVSRALRGQAMVYLDTVRPLIAEGILQEALRLIDGQQERLERAQVLDLLAENKTNRGQWEEAEALRRQAAALREEGPVEADRDARVLLRTGRLTEARRILEERAEAERRIGYTHRAPRGHRETLLVLSLIYALQGEAEAALRTAQEGTEVGRLLRSPFVEAVGYIRQGHAWQLSDQPGADQAAGNCYRRALEMSASLTLPRLEVEALWGLTRLYGFQGDLPTAEICAREATDKALRAGDEWIAALVGVTLGAAYAWHHTSGPSIAQQAIHWLSRSSATFRSCGDPFGQAVASLWLAWLALQGGRIPGIALDVTRHVRDLLKLIDSQGYPYLLGRRTLLGPPDSQAIVPLLLAASRGSSHSTLAQELVRQWGMANLEFHPGYSLRVQTLGIFRVWRGREEVTSAEWQRTRARQLFQLFITRRRQFIQREQILELLWPGASPEAAENQFKVVLTTLSKVLEPHRPAHVPPFFVIRHNSTYGLNPLALIQVDADSFEAPGRAGEG